MKTSVVNDPTILALFQQGISNEPVGASFGTRAGASVKMTPQGRKSYLENIYGQGNVEEQNGNLMIRQDGLWKRFDSEDFELGDIADLTGDAIEAIPPITVGMSTLNPFAVGAAGVGGNLLRQAISENLPGDDQMTIGQRAWDAAETGLIEAGAQKGVNMITKGYDAIRPRNLLARAVNKVADEDYVRQGDALENWMQKDAPEFFFSSGQRTGGKTRLTLEGLGRRHITAAKDVAELDMMQLQAAVKKLNKIMDDVSPGKPTPIRTGDAVKQGYSDVTERLIKNRSTQGDADFKRAWIAANGEKNINISQFRAALDEAVDDFVLPGSSGGVDTIANRINKIVGNFEENISAKDMQKLLARLGKAMNGKTRMFPAELLDKAAEMSFLKRLMKPLMGDLDNAVFEGVAGSKQLKIARDNWSTNSDAIEQMADTVLGRMLKDTRISPEDVLKKIYQMDASELGEMAATLKAIKPELYDKVGRGFLEDMYSKSMVSESGLDAVTAFKMDDEMLSTTKFATQLRKNKDKIDMYFGKGTVSEMDKFLKTIRRLNDQAKTQGSPTAPLLIAAEAAKSLMTLDPRSWIRGVSVMLGPKKIIQLSVKPETRKAVMSLAETSNWTKSAWTAAGIISYVANSEPVGQSARPVDQSIVTQ